MRVDSNGIKVYFFAGDEDVRVERYSDHIDAAILIYADYENSDKVFLIYGIEGEIIITKSISFVFKQILFLKPSSDFWFKCFDSFSEAYADACFFTDQDQMPSIKIDRFKNLKIKRTKSKRKFILSLSYYAVLYYGKANILNTIKEWQIDGFLSKKQAYDLRRYVVSVK